MKYIRKLLKFLQLVDREGNLSITNIATIVVITKIAIAASIDWGVISALLVTLLNYGHKRHESNKVRPTAQIAVDLKPLQDSINKMADDIQEVKKVADEAKDKASKVALASGLSTKRLG